VNSERNEASKPFFFPFKFNRIHHRDSLSERTEGRQQQHRNESMNRTDWRSTAAEILLQCHRRAAPQRRFNQPDSPVVETDADTTLFLMQIGVA